MADLCSSATASGAPELAPGAAPVGYGELLAVGFPAAWRWLRMASVSFRAPQVLSYGIWGYGAIGALACLWLGRWWPLMLVALVMALVAYLSVLIPLSAARAGRRGRILVQQATPAGRAYAVVRRRPCADSPDTYYWQFSDLVSVHSLRQPLPERRGDRPGALLLQQVQRSAAALGIEVRLTAANRTLAQKVYLPAGYVFDGPADASALRPKMHLELRLCAAT